LGVYGDDFVSLFTQNPGQKLAKQLVFLHHLLSYEGLGLVTLLPFDLLQYRLFKPLPQCLIGTDSGNLAFAENAKSYLDAVGYPWFFHDLYSNTSNTHCQGV